MFFFNSKKKKVPTAKYTFTVNLNLQGFRDVCKLTYEASSEKEAFDLADACVKTWVTNGCSIDKDGKVIYIPHHFIKSLELEKAPEIQGLI